MGPKYQKVFKKFKKGHLESKKCFKVSFKICRDYLVLVSVFLLSILFMLTAPHEAIMSFSISEKSPVYEQPRAWSRFQTAFNMIIGHR